MAPIPVEEPECGDSLLSYVLFVAISHPLLFSFLLCFFRAAATAYGSSQARNRIGAAVAGLHHSHSNMGSKLHLRPPPQLMAMLDS